MIVCLSGTLAAGIEPDTSVAFGVDMVKRRPVLPSVAVGKRLFVDDPGANFALPARSQADRLHQTGDQQAVVLGDGFVFGGGEQAFGNAGQAGDLLVAVEAVEVNERTLRQVTDKLGMMEEHQLLYLR